MTDPTTTPPERPEGATSDDVTPGSRSASPSEAGSSGTGPSDSSPGPAAADAGASGSEVPAAATPVADPSSTDASGTATPVAATAGTATPAAGTATPVAATTGTDTRSADSPTPAASSAATPPDTPSSSEQAGATPGGHPRPGDSQPGDPRPGDPRPGDARPGDAQPGYPSSGHPQSDPTQPGYPQSTYPESAYPESGYPQPGRPQAAGNPESGYPQSGYPQSGYPQSGYPRSGYPQPGYPQSDPTQPGYPRSGYPQSGYPQSGYPQAGYPQAGYPQSGGQQPTYVPSGHGQQAGYGQAAYGPPGPGAGQYGPPQGPPPTWPPGGRQPGRFGRRGPIWIGVGLVAVIAIVVGVLVAVTQLGPPSPDEAVSSAVDDLRGWGGITYHGEINQYSKGNITVDLTVNPKGDTAGTLTRPNGARAEYARIDGVELFKGDASWWKGDPQETDKVQHLAGIWVSNPLSEVSGLSTQITPPDKVASDLQPPSLGGSSAFQVYRETGTRDIAGQQGRVLEGIARKVILSEGDDPHVLGIVPLLSENPLEVSRPDPAALSRIDDRRSIRDSAPDYSKALYEKPNVTAQVVNLPPVCTTPKCGATVRLTNNSRFDADGSVQVLVNGQYGDFVSFSLRGGQTQDFPVSVSNPAPSGQTIPIRWEARVTAY